MSFLAGGRGQKARPQYTGFQTQTSSSVVCLPICYGRNRVAPNIIWFGDFKANKQKQRTGKGFSTSQTFYTYSASLEIAICVGEIDSITRMWKDQSKETSYTAAGWTLFTGTSPQAPWGYLVTAHPTEALGYPGVCYLAAANYDLGQTNTLGNHNFEVNAILYNTQVNGDGDADPAQIVDDLLTNQMYGVGFPATSLDDDSLFSGPNATTTGDSAYQTYCRAIGFGLSPFLVNQEPTNTILDRWAKLTNTAIVWPGYALKFIPRGEEEITGNGVTYLPPTEVVYALTDDDFVRAEGQDPVRMSRVDPADAMNSIKIDIRDRANDYNLAPIEWKDQGLIDQFGLRPASATAANEVCSMEMGGKMVALMGQRIAYIRNKFHFTLSSEYCLLEPMDVVTITDPRWGTFAVRIIEVNEGEDDNLTIVSEEFPASVSVSSGMETQGNGSTPINTAADPGPVNPPLIFDVPADMSAGVPQVWAAVSGGDGTNDEPNWGGAIVHVSADGGTTYQAIGEVTSAARMGVTTTSLAAYGGTNPQTGATVGVNLAMSDGQLMAVTAAEAASEATLSVLSDAAGGNVEFWSWETATLVSGNTYTLQDDFYRNLHGTTGLTHATGSRFARLDDNIFKYNLPPEYVGIALKFKFQSYNIWGAGLEDLSSVVAYDYIPTGLGYTSQPPGSVFVTEAPGVPGTLTVTGVYGANQLSWVAPSTGGTVAGYKIYAIHAASGSFGSASLIATVSGTGTQWTHGGLDNNDTWRYWVVAYNAKGDSTESGPTNGTTSSVGGSRPIGFGFQRDVSAITVSQAFVFFDPPAACTLPQNLPGSQGTIGGTGATAPSAQTDFDVQSPPGSSIGTMRFAASSLTATFIKAADSSIPQGQPIQIVAPANLNGMAGTLFGTLYGTAP